MSQHTSRLLFRFRLARAVRRVTRARRDLERVHAAALDAIIERDMALDEAARELATLEVEAVQSANLHNQRVLIAAGGLASTLPDFVAEKCQAR